MLRPLSEYERLALENPVTPYWDRTLRGCRRKYVRVARALLRRGLVSLHDPRAVRWRVGVFFVHRKTPGTMRLIIDARQVNLRYHTPPTVSLVTAKGFSMIEVEVDRGIGPDSDEGKRAIDALGITMGVGDVSGVFH